MESLQISWSELHIYLVLLSLEHAKLLNASTPHSNIGSFSQLMFDDSFESVDDRSSFSGISVKQVNPLRATSDYSSFELLSKAAVLETLHHLQGTHPYVEFFYHRPSQCTILVAHTGYDGTRMHKYDVHTHCHTNIGFQTFLKFVAEIYSKSVTEGRDSDHSTHLYSDVCERNGSSFKCFSEEYSLSNLSTVPQIETTIGYNVGDALLHLQSSYSTIFTSDGVQVHVEKQSFFEDSVFVGVSLLTEGHKIGCIKSDYFDNGLDEQFDDSTINELEIQQPTNSLDHLSMYAFLSNGLKVTTSYYGPNGNGCLMNMPTVNTIQSDPSSHLVHLPPQKIDNKHDRQQNVIKDLEPLQDTEMEIQKAEMQFKEECQLFASHNRHQHLFATTSYGLKTHIHVFIPQKVASSTSNESRKVFVKQEHYKTTQWLERQLEERLDETCRYYLPDGILVYSISDGSLIIHCSDGSIYRTATDSECDQYYHTQRLVLPTDQNRKGHLQVLEIHNQIRSASEIISVKRKQIWVVTLPNGKRFLWKHEDIVDCCEPGDDTANDRSTSPIPIDDVPCLVTTDPITKEVSYCIS